MRGIGAGFGLVAFMIAIAISLWMWGSYTAEVSHYGTQAQKQAEQFSGRDENGRPASQSISLKPEVQNGRLKYVLVDDIDPVGAYGKWFHLKENDQIIAVGPMGEVRDQDAEMATALIQEAYQRQWNLTVIRGGKKMVLPAGDVIDDGTSLAATATPATQPAPQAQQSDQEKVVPKELGPLKALIR